MSKKLFLLVSLLCVLGVLSNNVLADPNLLVRYSFDDGQATDETGNGNHGIMSTAGVTSYADSNPARGYVMNFDTGYITVPAPVFTPITNAVTITLWQNGASTQPVNNCGFQGDAGTTGRIFSTNLPWGSGSVFWDAGHTGTGDGTANYDRTSKAATADQYKEKWNHWAFSKNTATGEMKVYINGQLFVSASGKTMPITGCTRFNIGAGSNSTSNFYKGMIDDFRIYNKIFTQKELLEVAELYSAKQQAPDGLTNLSVTQTLSWIAAFSESRSFQVYYGVVSDDVKNSTAYSVLPGVTLVNVAANTTSLTRTFAPATTYYWRVDVVDSGTTYPDEAIHTFSTGLANSYNFLPADGATGLAINKVVLSWTPGSLPVTGYNVYLGTASSALVKVSSAQTASSYTPASLLANKTYFWKIEDVASPVVPSPVMSFSTIDAVDPNLVGWWKFDQAGAPNAVDSSGNGHTATFFGAAAIADDGSGSALSLPATTDFVTVVGYKGLLGKDALSTAAWIKTTTGGAVIAWGKNSSGNKWHMRIENGFVRTGLSGGYGIGTTDVNDGTWHHIAAGIIDNGTAKDIITYVDGVKDSYSNVPAATVMNILSSADVNVGSWLPDSDHYTGSIKDVRIYNKLISQKEVLELAGNNYTQAQSPDNQTGLPLQVTFSWVAAFSQSRTFKLYYGTDPGLVGATMQIVTNASSYTATLASNTTYYWRVDTVIGSNTYQDAKIHTFTVAPANSYNFLPVNGATGLTPDKTSLSWSAGSLAVTGYNVYLGTNQTWVTAGSNGTKLTATPQTDTSFKPTNLLENTTYFWRIEDVRTPIVTSTVMTFTTGKLIDPALVGWWNFKSVTATVVPDDSGNSHTGTLTGAGAAVIVDPERGPVLSLHGGGEYVLVAGYKGILGANARTTAAWIKTSTTGTTPRGIIAWGGNSTNQRWDMVLYNNNLRQMIYNSNRTATPIINDGNWHHVASVLKGGTDTNLNTVILYVDGVKASASGDSATVNTVSSKDVRIGDADAVSGTGRNFVGELSDVRLYNRALTDAEVAALATLPNVTVIDNMEDYNDFASPPKPINGLPNGWRDNFSFNHEVGGNAFIGLPPYTYKGGQSLGFNYDNSDLDLNGANSSFCSEIVKVFATPQDWSFNTTKAKILTIPVLGALSPGNLADKIYMVLEDDAKKSYILYYKKSSNYAGGDASITNSTSWVKWEINLDLAKTAINLARISKFYIGVGDRYVKIQPDFNLTGTLYIDEITLNPSHCNPVDGPTVGDLTNDCIVNFKDAKLMAANWLVADVTVSPQTIPADGNLVAQYNFDNSDATDSSGYGNDCNTVGTINYVADDPQHGMVASFDGSVGNSLNTGGGPGGWAIFRSSMTYCAWIKVDQFTSNMQCLIGTSGSYRISRNGTTNMMRLYNDPLNNGTLAGVTPVNDNIWHHVCGVVNFDAASNSTTYTLYLDGKIENSVKKNGRINPLAGNVTIGADDTTQPGREWKGLVDDVRFYNRALSHGEVLTLAGITHNIIIPVNDSVNLKKTGANNTKVDGYEIIDYRDFSQMAQSWMIQNYWP